MTYYWILTLVNGQQRQCTVDKLEDAEYQIIQEQTYLVCDGTMQNLVNVAHICSAEQTVR